MRKDIFVLTLIIAVGTISIFGALGFGSLHHQGNHYCPISSLSAGNCAARTDVLSFLNHHISGVAFAAEAIFGYHLSLLLFALSLLLILFAFPHNPAKHDDEKLPAIRNIQYRRNLLTSVFYTQQLRRRWSVLCTMRYPFSDHTGALLPVFL